MRRILTYAVVYGLMGASVGVLMAIWTKEGEEAAKPILLQRATGQPARRTRAEQNGESQPEAQPVEPTKSKVEEVTTDGS